jgi:hypothetical protein
MSNWGKYQYLNNQSPQPITPNPKLKTICELLNSFYAALHLVHA